MTTRPYGWIRDTHDGRDMRLSIPQLEVDQLPPSIDLTADAAMPPVWDQGQLGSCTAHGTMAGFMWASAKCGADDPMLSRLMLYYDTRDLEGTVGDDSGAQVRDAVKATKTGICPEDMWPYDIEKFTVQPPDDARQAAAANEGLQYTRVDQNLDDLRAVLASGFPVVFGFTVYDSFESEAVAQSGIVDMPQSDEQAVGGHCVALVGYDDATRRFKVRNSWGTGWGQSGYFTMPYDYITNEDLASDFWQLEKVS